MRTLKFIKDEKKKKRISYETLEIYSPLAERLGMEEIRKELDDLSFNVTEPELRDSIIQRLLMLRQQDEDILDKIIKNIETFLLENKIIFKVFGREKTPYSIWKKIPLQKQTPFLPPQARNLAQTSGFMAVLLPLRS